MFSVHCDHCASDVLLSTRRIAVRNTPAGIEVDWVCWEGHRGTWRPAALAPTTSEREAELVSA
jgi:hypothetical protein